jgi:Flp pilus assembly protein TadG
MMLGRLRTQLPRPMVRYARRMLGEQGSAVLETALSMVLLLTFLFGIMETSLMLYTYHFISEASREATRYAIVRGFSAGPTCASYTSAGCAVTSAQVDSYVRNINLPGIDPSNMPTIVPVYQSYPTGAACSPSRTCNNPGNLVTVKVVYNFPLNIPFVPAHTYTMSSTSAMVISQ